MSLPSALWPPLFPDITAPVPRACGLVLLASVLLLGSALEARGQVTWTGDGDGTSWSDAANWSSQQVPGSGDDVVIDAPSDSTYTVELTAARTVASLRIDSRDATLALAADLTVSGAYDHVFGTLDGDGELVAEGALTWNAGTMTGSGSTVADGGGQIDGGLLDARRFVVSTGQTVRRTNSFAGSNGAVLEVENEATLAYETNRSMYVESGSTSPPRILNRGTLTVNAAPADLSWALENHGTLEVEPDQRLRFEGPLTDAGGTYRAAGPNGRLDIRPDADVTFNSSSALAAEAGGVLSLSHSADTDTAPSITIEGTYDVRGITKLGEKYPAVEVAIVSSADVQNLAEERLIVGDRGRLRVETTDPLTVGGLGINFEGTLSMSGDLTVEGPMNLNNASARFETDQTLTVDSLLTWEGGTVAGTGTTLAAGGLDLIGGAGSASNNKQLDEHRVVLPSGATGSYSGALLSGGNGAVLEVEDGAVFDIRAASDLDVFSGSTTPPTVRNRGTVQKTVENQSRVDWALENSGTIRVDFSGGGSTTTSELSTQEVETRTHNRISDLRLNGALEDKGGVYRAVGGGTITFRQARQTVPFEAESVIEADSSGEVRFRRQSDPDDLTVTYAIKGAYDVAGSTSIEGTSSVARVTLASVAELRTLGALRIDRKGALLANADVTVEGPMTLANTDARYESDQRMTVEGMLTWEGGTVVGDGTITAAGGLTLPRGAGSASFVKRFDGHRITLPTGTTGRYPGAKFRAGNGAVLKIEDGAVFDVQTSSDITVFSGSTTRPKVINRGTLRKTATENRTTLKWAVDNHGTVAVDFGTSGSSTAGVPPSSAPEGDVQTRSHANTPADLNLRGPLTDHGGTYRAVRDGQLSFRQKIDAVTFGDGSMVEADSSGTISFGRPGSVENRDTSAVYTLEGGYDVRGTTELRGANAADVTITDAAEVQSVGGAAISIGANNGVLRTAFSDPFVVGRATIGRKSRLVVRSDLTVEGTMTLDDGRFESPRDLTVRGTLDWEGGTMTGSGTTTVDGLHIKNGGTLDGRRLVLAGDASGRHTGGEVEGRGGAVLEIEQGATFDIQTGFNWGTADSSTVLNNGTLKKTDGGRGTTRWTLDNRGTMIVDGGQHLRQNGPVLDRGGTYRVRGRLDVWPDTTSVALASGSALVVDDDARFTYESDSALTIRGRLETRGDLYTERPLSVDGGTVTLSDPGTVIRGTFGSVPSDPDSALHLVDGGALYGTGFVTGDVASDSGTVRPGGPDTTGVLAIQGDYVQRTGATLDLEVGGTSAGDQHDRLDVESVELGGTLRLALVDDYVPGEDDLLRPLRWSGDRRDLFDSIEQNTGDVRLAVEYGADALRVFDGSLPEPPEAPDVSVRVDAAPFTRTDDPAPITINVSSSSDQAVGRLETTSIDIGASAPERSCPQDDAYENLKCRLAPFGVEPPEPSEDESYPFLVRTDLGSIFSAASKRKTDRIAQSGTSEVEETTATDSAPVGAGPKATTRAKILSIGGGTFNVGGTGTCPGAGENLKTGAEVPGPIMTNESLDRCANEIVDDVLESVVGLIPGSDCVTLAADLGTGFRDNFDTAGAMAATTLSALDCAGGLVPSTKAIKVMNELNSTIRDAQDFKGCFADGGGGGSGGAQTTCVASIDPNEKRGPSGVGPERYTSQTDSLPYTILFENKPEATAPAQRVTITDTLGTDPLNASAFSFGPVVVADTLLSVPRDTTAFEKKVDLRPERDLILSIKGSLDETSGVLRWTFSSLDPETGDPVSDPLAGFLPPNEEPPEGEGSVSYFPTLGAEVESGTRFGGAAEIVFDDNDPIDTGVWANTLDIDPPSSQVNSLASTQNDVDFPVQWDGTDAESGVRTYSVYVSKNGGTFTEWIADTTAASATFEGERGARYSFYSLATDSVGLTEPTPETADASTKVSADAIPVELTHMEATLSEEGTVALTWKTASETNNAGFEVQRRAGPDGSFQRVGFVEGSGTTSEPQSYRFTDERLPYAADTLRYRLRQVDTDGTAHRTDPVAVGRGGPERVELRETFPNPVRNRATVRYAIPDGEGGTGEVTVGLYDLLGRRVQTLRPDGGPGRHEVQFQVRDLASGVYVLRLEAGGQTRTQRLTVVR